MATTGMPKLRISGGSFLLEERETSEVFTPEDFTEQHQLIGQTTEEFAVNEILPNVERIEHKEYIAEHGEDLPEIRNWKWGANQ